MANNIFDLESFKAQLEELKKQLEEQRAASEGVDDKSATEDRWSEHKEAFGKMLDAYDAFLPKADVAKIFSTAATQLEKAADALKEMQATAQAQAEEENKGEEE